MKQFLFTNILFWFCTSLFAQLSTLNGQVQLADGTPVGNATIRISGTSLLALANEGGEFTFNNVPLGKQVLLVSSLEVKDKAIPIVIKEAKQSIVITLEASDNIHLDEVSVVRNTVKRDIETQGFAVNVIETKEGALRNIQTNELLDRTVGVRVRQQGGLGSEVQYNLNGMTGRSVGVFLDGIEISTYGSSFNLNNIPPSMIERIEVYKGVLPAHLTGDFLGGAINIVLKKGGKAANNLTASLSYGSFNTTQSDISALYRNEKSGFTTRIAGSFINTDNDYEIWGKFSKFIEPNGVVHRNYRTKRFFDGYRTYTGRFEFGYTDVKWADAFFIGYNVSDSYKEIQHGQTMGRPYMGRTSEANANVLSVTYTKKDVLTEGLDFSVNGVYSFRNTDLTDTVSLAYNWDGNIRLDLNGNPIKTLDGGQQGKPVLTGIKRRVANIRSNLGYDVFSGHRLSINHVFYTVDRKDRDRLLPPDLLGLSSTNDLSKNVVSFNYEAQTLSNRLTTNLFYKLYHQNLGSTSYTVQSNGQSGQVIKNKIKENQTNSGYGLAASFQVKPTFILMASGERAIRMPASMETFGSPEENVLENLGISPEISDNLNLGFRIGSFQFNDHRISFGSNFFWRNVKDRIMPQANELLNNQEIELTQYVNLGLTQSLGFEGELYYSYKNNFSLTFNFSKFNSLFKQKYDPSTGKRMTYYNKQIPNEPFYTMNGNVHYRFSDALQKNAQLNLFIRLVLWPLFEQFGQKQIGSLPRDKSRRIWASVTHSHPGKWLLLWM